MTHLILAAILIFTAYNAVAEQTKRPARNETAKQKKAPVKKPKTAQKPSLPFDDGSKNSKTEPSNSKR